MGSAPEGFPEFIPSTSRVSARRHLVDESPALTAVLQARRRHCSSAGTLKSATRTPVAGTALRCVSTDCGPGTGWGFLCRQPLSRVAVAATAATIKSDLMALPSCHRRGQR